MVLYQPKDGYCYNSDTHFLFAFITKCLEKYKNINGKLLDVGCGSGILGLLLAREYNKLELHQYEIQKIFQELCSINAKNNKLNNILHCGDFLDNEFINEFDYIVSNPPFYNNDVIKSENEILKIARYNDFMPLEEFIKKASKSLKNGGKFFFCYDAKQIINISIFSKKYGLNIESIQFVHPTNIKEASLIMVFMRKNSKTKTSVINPIIVFENGVFTDEVNEIYKKIGTYSIKV